jgi:hypothetical protein
MKKIMVAVVLGSVLLSSDVFAQETWSSEPSAITLLQGGEYKDLTFLRKLRLAAASYVDPDLVASTVVAYKYDISNAIDATGGIRAGIGDMAKAGEIALGTVDIDGLVSVSTAQNVDLIAALATMKDAGVLVSARPVKGFTGGSPIISWAPQGQISRFSPIKLPK